MQSTRYSTQIFMKLEFSRQIFFLIFFIVQKVSNIHLVTKDFKIFPLTNLLKLLLAGRVVGGGVYLVRFILMQH